jgi:hypothetical protein
MCLGAEVAQLVQCLATDLTTRRSTFDPGGGKEDFSSSLSPVRLWGPPSLLYNGYRGSFLRGKVRPGRDADHSLSSAEVENE